MDTLHHPPVIDPERVRYIRERLDEAAAELGLDPEPWPPWAA